MPKPERKADCHPERSHCARGLCASCYNSDRRKERYAKDPEFRKAVHRSRAKWARKRYATDPDYRAKKLLDTSIDSRRRRGTALPREFRMGVAFDRALLEWQRKWDELPSGEGGPE